MNTPQTAVELLAQSSVTVDPHTFYLIGLRHDEWQRLLENPELAPSGAQPYMVLRDRSETTLLLEESDWKTLRHTVRDARVEGDFRLLTFELQLDWKVVGFLALVTGFLAAAEIPVGAISAFSRDHLMIKQADLAKTMIVLGEHVKEMC